LQRFPSLSAAAGEPAVKGSDPLGVVVRQGGADASLEIFEKRFLHALQQVQSLPPLLIIVVGVLGLFPLARGRIRVFSHGTPQVNRRHCTLTCPCF
jgi:hypothetical protein